MAFILAWMVKGINWLEMQMPVVEYSNSTRQKLRSVAGFPCVRDGPVRICQQNREPMES